MDNELITGFIPSIMDGSELVFGVTEPISIPDEYTYVDNLPEVLDQGSAQICVPCTVSSYLNWRENLKDGSTKNNYVYLYEIYGSRTNTGEGMTYKDALKFLRKKGVKSKFGHMKINSYGKVTSSQVLKYALILNGPCFSALPVFSKRDRFWEKWVGDRLEGYHAIAIVGYNSEGFIIRNSWGKSFGDNGYVILPYNDFDKLIETWTVMD